VAANAGFRFAELWLDARYLADWRTVAELAREYPLQYALHFPNHGTLDDHALENVVALYRRLGCTVMVIHEPMFRHYHRRILDRASSIRLAVENHHLPLSKFEQWALENTWLTLDVEHFWKLTLKDAPFDALMGHLQTLLPRIATKLVHVHLPGYLPGYAEHRPIYCAREMVFPTLSLLAEQDFDGFVVSEVNPDFQNPLELQMDMLLFRRWSECEGGHRGQYVQPRRTAV
jgi:sugar phosphate isomerase/epimerase